MLLSYFEEHTPNKWLPSKVYAEQFNAFYYQVYDRTLVKQEAFVCYGSRKIDFELKLCSEFPDLGIIELKKGRIIGRVAIAPFNLPFLTDLRFSIPSSS